MNIKNIRKNIQAQINTIYLTDINHAGTAQVIRAETNALLEELRLLEQPLPPCNDAHYSRVAGDFYHDMVNYWRANTTDVYQIIAAIKAARFAVARTPLQTWTHLHEFAKELDRRSSTQWERAGWAVGVGLSNRWSHRCQAMHPDRLAEYRITNRSK